MQLSGQEKHLTLRVWAVCRCTRSPSTFGGVFQQVNGEHQRNSEGIIDSSLTPTSRGANHVINIRPEYYCASILGARRKFGDPCASACWPRGNHARIRNGRVGICRVEAAPAKDRTCLTLASFSRGQAPTSTKVGSRRTTDMPRVDHRGIFPPVRYTPYL